MQYNKISCYCISTGNNPYLLPATDSLSLPRELFSLQQRKIIYKKKRYPLKKKQPSLAVKGCGQMHKCSGEKSCEIHTGGNQKMAVMIGQWQNFNNNNSGKLGADSQLSWNEVT